MVSTFRDTCHPAHVFLLPLEPRDVFVLEHDIA